MDKEEVVYLYSDGACLGNPGKGGWAALLVIHKEGKKYEKLLSGKEAQSTNNQMELQAVIEGLKQLKRPCKVKVYSDSQYVIKGMTEWIHKWKKNGFKTANKKPIANQNHWLALAEVAHKHQITWHWVKGHNGHPENERVDQAAQAAAKAQA